MNQKLELLLNLALEATPEEREQSEQLLEGFDPEERTWELIVKYQGSLEQLETMGIPVEYLIAGYAILTVPESLLFQVSQLPQIEYVEKPKRFYYSQILPTEGSCYEELQSMGGAFGLNGLRGNGVLIAVLDSGIDYQRRDFRRADGTTRILSLWDQTLVPGSDRRPPEGFSQGVEFGAEEINAALREESPQARFEVVPSRDVSGHGTAVAGIAAGYADGGNGDLYSGMAPAADLLIVKLGAPRAEGFPRTTEIMRGVTYALRKANERRQPLVINLSFGNSYGAHDGSSLLERFLDNAAEIGRTVICVGSGNEGDAAGHFAGNVMTERRVELAVAPYEMNLSLQIWKNVADVYDFVLESPSGRRLTLTPAIEGGKYTALLQQTKVLVYWGEPSPYAVSQEIFLEFLPAGSTYIDSGVWTLFIEPRRVVTGQYYLYLPGGTAQSTDTGFFMPSPQVTLTIPATSAKVLTVGAYDSRFESYASFSGRGAEDREGADGVVNTGFSKPDLVAPGVDILAPTVYGGYQAVTGTSFATPIVSGGAALLMEWGILQGNDSFLYGERMKAYLRAGAAPIRGEQRYPNGRTGWGKLCLRDSILRMSGQ